MTVLILTTQEIEAESARLAALRMQLLEMHPFWGYLLLQMRLVPTLDIPTMGTDCIKNIWFNPVFTRTLDNRELGFVLTHEICHSVQEDNLRQRGREPVKWNMAMDFAINDLVSRITVPGSESSRYSDGRYYKEAVPLYKLPAGGLLSGKYSGMVAETIYEHLCMDNEGSACDTVYVDVALQDPDGGGTMKFHHLPWAGGCCDIHLPLELDEDQRETLRMRIAAAVEVYKANDERGDIPGDLLRTAETEKRPRIPWRRVLHHYADTILRQDDYSLARPNRRFMMEDLLVPGRYDEKLEHLVVSLDTSGSMDSETIRAVLTELRGMVESSQEITLLVADCRIQQVVTGEELDPFLAAGRYPGGGGTDHICVFDYIREHRLNPGLFVGLTDLYSVFPERKPSYPVLWLVPEVHGNAPWGKVIELPKGGV